MMEKIILMKPQFQQDSLNQQIEIEPIKTIVLARVESVKRNEFYQAYNSFKPEITFVIKGYEYEDEPYVLFDEKKYKVMRTFRKNYEEIELICSLELKS